MALLCSCRLMLIDDGISQSVFNKADRKLENTEYQKALKFVGRYKDMDRYRSLMDFVFCETFPTPWRRKCFLYYEGEGVQLKDDPNVTKSKILLWDRMLCKVLDDALFLLNYDREKKWNWKGFISYCKQEGPILHSKKLTISS